MARFRLSPAVRRGTVAGTESALTWFRVAVCCASRPAAESAIAATTMAHFAAVGLATGMDVWKTCWFTWMGVDGPGRGNRGEPGAATHRRVRGRAMTSRADRTHTAMPHAERGDLPLVRRSGWRRAPVRGEPAIPAGLRSDRRGRG